MKMIRHYHIAVNLIFIGDSLVIKPFIDEVDVLRFRKDTLPFTDCEGDEINAVGCRVFCSDCHIVGILLFFHCFVMRGLFQRVRAAESPDRETPPGVKIFDISAEYSSEKIM